MPASPLARRATVLPALALTAALVVLSAAPAAADVPEEITAGTFLAPRTAIFSPDGTTLYVADEASDRIAVIDVATGTVTEHATLLGSSDGHLAISSDGRYVYGSDTGNWRVNVFDTVTHVSTFISAEFPAGLALSPDDATLYVASILNARVDSYDVATGTLLDSYPAGSFPIDVALSADGSRFWVANSGSNYVTTYPTADPLDRTDVAVGGIQHGVALSIDGGTLWAATSNATSIAAIDTATLTTGAPIDISPSSPWDVAIHPDGERLYAVDRAANEIVVVDGVTRTVVTTLPAGDEPWQLAVAPNGSRVAAANYFSTFVTVLTRPAVSIAGSSAQAGVPGSTLTLTATAEPAGGFDSVQWQSDTGSGFTDVPAATGLTLDVTVGASTQYRLVARSSVFGDVPSPVVTVAQELARTGVEVAGLAAAVALVLLGAMLLVLRRRSARA